MCFKLIGELHGSGQTLAKQLLRADTQERVELLDLRGSSAHDIEGALVEWYKHSKRTACLRYLYSLSIVSTTTPHDIGRTQYFGLIERIEERLGLSGQPRLVVLTTDKGGFETWHVVWSRIHETKDGTRALHFSHDRQKLHRVARDFCRDHGISSSSDTQN